MVHREKLGKNVGLYAVLALCCAALAFLCVFCLQRHDKDAISFYAEFLPTEKLYVDEKNVLFWEYLDDGMLQKTKLKYADQLEFDEDFKVDMQITGVHGRTVEYDIINLTNHDIKLSGDVLLLKNIAGVWYIVPNEIIYRDLSGVNAYLNVNSIRHREVCLSFGAGNQRIRQDDDLILWRCHSIPAGEYALFFEVNKPEFRGELEIATGGAIIQFELESSESPQTYDVDALYQFVYSEEYVIGSVSETLYKDPYK